MVSARRTFFSARMTRAMAAMLPLVERYFLAALRTTLDFGS